MIPTDFQRIISLSTVIFYYDCCFCVGALMNKFILNQWNYRGPLTRQSHHRTFQERDDHVTAQLSLLDSDGIGEEGVTRFAAFATGAVIAKIAVRTIESLSSLILQPRRLPFS
jgi:hypothetical protein